MIPKLNGSSTKKLSVTPVILLERPRLRCSKYDLNVFGVTGSEVSRLNFREPCAKFCPSNDGFKKEDVVIHSVLKFHRKFSLTTAMSKKALFWVLPHAG